METHKNAKVNYGMFAHQFNELNELNVCQALN